MPQSKSAQVEEASQITIQPTPEAAWGRPLKEGYLEQFAQMVAIQGLTDGVAANILDPALRPYNAVRRGAAIRKRPEVERRIKQLQLASASARMNSVDLPRAFMESSLRQIIDDNMEDPKAHQTAIKAIAVGVRLMGYDRPEVAARQITPKNVHELRAMLQEKVDQLADLEESAPGGKVIDV